jgi:hypothetical protein
VVIEPVRRDSAPALAAAAALAKSRDPNAVVLAPAADHVILDVEEFRETCRSGLEAAEAGRIVTFGIQPTELKTSYGYIRRGKPIGSLTLLRVILPLRQLEYALMSRVVSWVSRCSIWGHLRGSAATKWHCGGRSGRRF